MSDTATKIISLLERIQQLELEVTLSQPLYSRRQLEARLEKTELERDAALERLRSFEKGVPIGSGSPETLLKLLDENRSLELERDAALEWVRVLEEAKNA